MGQPSIWVTPVILYITGVAGTGRIWQMVIELQRLKSRDPDGAKLRSLLEAERVCERMAEARSLIAQIMAITGAVIWLEAIWPGLIHPEIQFFAVGAFGAGLILGLGFGIEEIAWRVRRKQCAKANQVGG
jgi:hypothetical protein